LFFAFCPSKIKPSLRLGLIVLYLFFGLFIFGTTGATGLGKMTVIACNSNTAMTENQTPISFLAAALAKEN